MKRKPPGTLIAFAAAPGRVARQSPNRLSPYTAVLLSQLDRLNMSLFPLFRAVQDEVWKVTNGDQEPHIDFSPGLQEIILNRIKEKDSINAGLPNENFGLDEIAASKYLKYQSFENNAACC